MQIVRIYPAQFEESADGVCVVTFRDIPEAITQADDKIEAVGMAVDALYTSSDFYLENKRAMPEPSDQEDGDVMIPLYCDSEEIAAQLFPEVPFVLDEFHYHEAMDRLFLICDNAEVFLVDHPAVIAEPEVMKTVRAAISNLHIAYQKLAEAGWDKFPSEKANASAPG